MVRTTRIAVVAFGLVWLAASQAQETVFDARLTTVPISPDIRADVTGRGAARAELVGRQLRIRGEFEGLQTAASAAHLHLGAVTGVRGAAIHTLEVEPSARGTLLGRVELSRAQVQALRDGRLYIQVDSQGAPDGNLWGWLLP